MVNKKLLDKELKYLIYNEKDLKSIKYTKNLFKEFFYTYNNFKMEEVYYDYNKLNSHCWIEIIENGVFDYNLEKVKKEILKREKGFKKYLYNSRKYGGNRLHIYEKDGECFIFIYLRDILNVDYNIWFNNI